MPTITIGPRVRKSPYYDATIRHGAQSFTIYNHTFMPMNYESDPEVEFSKLLNGVQIWDVGCERQVQITGPDTMKLAQHVAVGLIVTNPPHMIRIGNQRNSAQNWNSPPTGYGHS